METSGPEIVTPDKVPDPWLLDSEHLLRELARIRSLALQIPVTLDNASSINTVITAVWGLEDQLRFLLHLHRDGQRSFARKAKALEKKTRKAAQLRTAERIRILKAEGKLRPDYQA